MRIQLSITCNTFLAFIIGFLFVSCDPDDRMDGESYSYQVAIQNNSEKPLVIKGFRTKDLSGTRLPAPEVITSLEINANTLSKKERVIVPKPLGNIAFGFAYPTFNNGSDSIVLMFADNTGYYSNNNDTDFWIANKSPLLSVLEKDITNEDGMLIYTISQEDYENAHVLP